MPQFKVLVSEHVTHSFIVIAESQDEAEAMFDDDDFEIEPDKSDTTEWFVAGVVELGIESTHDALM